MAEALPRVESVDRALQLLLALADAGPDGAQLADLAKATGVNKSTAYRCLSTMRGRGFAEQSDDGGYRLGPAAFALTERTYSPRNLATAMHPALVALARTTNELVHFGVLTGDHILYLDKVEPERALRVWSAIGQRMPVASTAMGRALLAAREVPDHLLPGYLRSVPAARPITAEQLHDSVRTARRLGYAVEHGENEPDISCLGTVIMQGPTPVGALSITAPAGRMTPDRETELASIIAREVPPLLPQGLRLLPTLG
ncbi:MAG TPA: IclR family transcriptional regulator [Arachnia sp.]|nr:IclR family transcriptional regulator [Arachnia sp.]HMT85652.1 IclR family transcriptional regulator [Arachnia sp.]